MSTHDLGPAHIADHEDLNEHACQNLHYSPTRRMEIHTEKVSNQNSRHLV